MNRDLISRLLSRLSLALGLCDLAGPLTTVRYIVILAINALCITILIRIRIVKRTWQPHLGWAGLLLALATFNGLALLGMKNPNFSLLGNSFAAVEKVQSYLGRLSSFRELKATARNETEHQPCLQSAYLAAEDMGLSVDSGWCDVNFDISCSVSCMSMAFMLMNDPNRVSNRGWYLFSRLADQKCLGASACSWIPLTEGLRTEAVRRLRNDWEVYKNHTEDQIRPLFDHILEANLGIGLYRLESSRQDDTLDILISMTRELDLVTCWSLARLIAGNAYAYPKLIAEDGTFITGLIRIKGRGAKNCLLKRESQAKYSLLLVVDKKGP